MVALSHAGPDSAVAVFSGSNNANIKVWLSGKAVVVVDAIMRPVSAQLTDLSSVQLEKMKVYTWKNQMLETWSYLSVFSLLSNEAAYN